MRGSDEYEKAAAEALNRAELFGFTGLRELLLMARADAVVEARKSWIEVLADAEKSARNAQQAFAELEKALGRASEEIMGRPR